MAQGMLTICPMAFSPVAGAQASSQGFVGEVLGDPYQLVVSVAFLPTLIKSSDQRPKSWKPTSNPSDGGFSISQDERAKLCHQLCCMCVVSYNV